MLFAGGGHRCPAPWSIPGHRGIVVYQQAPHIVASNHCPCVQQTLLYWMKYPWTPSHQCKEFVKRLPIAEACLPKSRLTCVLSKTTSWKKNMHYGLSYFSPCQILWNNHSRPVNSKKKWGEEEKCALHTAQHTSDRVKISGELENRPPVKPVKTSNACSHRDSANGSHR